MELEELFLNDYEGWRVISQHLLISKSHFTIVVEIEELFLNNYGAFNEPTSLVTHNQLSTIGGAFFFCVFDLGVFSNLFFFF